MTITNEGVALENWHATEFEEMPSIREIGHDDAVFPHQLKSVFGSSIPKSLYVMGNIELMAMDGIGFCGSRNAEEKVLDITRECAKQTVGAGITVVSGYAAGVDTAAHFTALNEGGNTIIVLPEGINRFKIKKIFRDVWDWSRILVVSQYDPQDSWQTWRAMERNKTIMAISSVMVVISAGEKGGTLHAGMSALKHDISLYVADFGDADRIAPGNLHLINKGAKKFGLSQSHNKPNLNRLFDEIRHGVPRKDQLQPTML